MSFLKFKSRTKVGFCSLLVGAALSSAATADIDQIWLTHRGDTPSKIVVNWHSGHPANPVVE